MSATPKILRKEFERLKNALKRVLKPRESQPQLVLQPVRNQHNNLKNRN